MLRSPRVTDQREVTYLASYPVLIATTRNWVVPTQENIILLATLVYGWMPRIVRIDTAALGPTEACLGRFDKSGKNLHEVVYALGLVLSSVVGASKWLHFWRPEQFPIWDSRIERARLGKDPGQLHMRKVNNYLNYRDDVLAARKQAGPLRTAFNPAFSARLSVHGIPSYEVSDVRMIEYLLFNGAGAD